MRRVARCFGQHTQLLTHVSRHCLKRALNAAAGFVQARRHGTINRIVGCYKPGLDRYLQTAELGLRQDAGSEGRRRRENHRLASQIRRFENRTVFSNHQNALEPALLLLGESGIAAGLVKNNIVVRVHVGQVVVTRGQPLLESGNIGRRAEHQAHAGASADFSQQRPPVFGQPAGCLLRHNAEAQRLRLRLCQRWRSQQTKSDRKHALQPD